MPGAGDRGTLLICRQGGGVQREEGLEWVVVWITKLLAACVASPPNNYKLPTAPSPKSTSYMKMGSFLCLHNLILLTLPQDQPRYVLCLFKMLTTGPSGFCCSRFDFFKFRIMILFILMTGFCGTPWSSAPQVSASLALPQRRPSRADRAVSCQDTAGVGPSATWTILAQLISPWVCHCHWGILIQGREESLSHLFPFLGFYIGDVASLRNGSFTPQGTNGS